MITEPTIFILGAGASHPYGLPLGLEMRKQIISIGEKATSKNHLEPQQHLENDFRKIIAQSHNQNWVQDIRSLGQHFDDTDMPSIDIFLNLPDYKDRYEKVGKLLIAYLVLRQERETFIKNPRPEDQNWMRYLWTNHLRCFDFQELLENRLTIITFNYDRSFEFYFRKVINKTFPKEEIDIEEIFNIVHVYGQVGKLGKMKNGKELSDSDAIIYNHHNDGNILLRASESISLIYETRKDETTMEEIRNYITEAQSVYFLGFGYDELNLSILGWDNEDLRTKKNRYGTAYGMTPNEIRNIPFGISDFNENDESFGRSSHNTNVKIYPCDCLQLLRDCL